MKTSVAEGWALVIAAVALAFSGASWLDMRRQLKLFSGQVRAYVQVMEAKLLEPISETSLIHVQLRLRNLGQTAAVGVHGEMDYDLGMPEATGKGNEATHLDFGAMGPGLERLVTLTSNRFQRGDWPKPSQRGDRAVYFFGTIWYADDTTGDRRKEDWCYQLPLKQEADLIRTALEPCTILGYKSMGWR